MLVRGESSSVPNLELPEELVRILPSDPFEQLDVARKITSIALSTRVDALQSESSALRAELAEKEKLIAELQAQVESFDASLSETADKLEQAQQDKENLVKENASLSNTLRKLSRDVSKLEVFRRTLMKSLQEDEENSGGGPDIVAKLQSQASITSTSSQLGEWQCCTFYSFELISFPQILHAGIGFAQEICMLKTLEFPLRDIQYF